MSMRSRIAVVGAVPAAAPPAVAALAGQLPEAEILQLLDDRLISDAEVAGGLTPALVARMHHLLDHAALGGAAAIVMTCSLYAPVAADAESRISIPVLGPDEAAFEELAALAGASVQIVSGVPVALEDATTRLRSALGERTDLSVEPILSVDARTASLRLDAAATARAIEGSLRERGALADTIYLANYSLALAADELAASTGARVMTGPASMAKALRRLLEA